jgi:hypothetical protein
MQAWEKHLIDPAFNAFFETGIGAIERKWPGLPAKPDHRAPFVYYSVLFGHEHANFSPFKRRRSCEFRPNRRTLSEVTLPMRFVTSKNATPKPLIRGTKVWAAMNAPTNALKIPESDGSAHRLAASSAHLLPPSSRGPHVRDR